MARSKTGTPPKYRHHKARNLAKVTIDRRDIYLGTYESAESYQKYSRVVAGWRQGMSGAEIKAMIQGKAELEIEDLPTSLLTVGKLSFRYWTEHAGEYFKSSTGLSRGRVANVRAAIRAANDFYSELPANSFTPVEFRQVRDSLVRRGLTAC